VLDTNAASQPATNVEPYIQADGTKSCSLIGDYGPRRWIGAK
jgi:hypothetical protein